MYAPARGQAEKKFCPWRIPEGLRGSIPEHVFHSPYCPYRRLERVWHKESNSQRANTILRDPKLTPKPK